MMTESTGKEKRQKRLGVFIIANSIVWGIVIIATAFVLRGTGLMGKLIPILGGGAAMSDIFLPTLLIEKKAK